MIRRLLFWMLVIVLPFIGLIAGIWLKPTSKPRWHKTHNNAVQILGYVDSASMLLVMEQDTFEQKSLIGYLVDTGNEVFRHTLTNDALKINLNHVRDARLSFDGNSIFLPAESPDDEDEKKILVYDWRKNQILKRLAQPIKVPAPLIANDQSKLVASAFSSLAIWDLRSDQLQPTQIKTLFGFHGISDDFNMAYGRWTDFNETKVQEKLFIKELKANSNRIPLLPLSSPFVSVLSMPGKERIVLLEMDPITQTYVIRQYHWKQDHYEHLAEKDQPLGSYGHPTVDRDTVYVDEALRMQPWRRKVAGWLGRDLSQFINRFGKKEYVVHVYERKTMKYLHTFSLPVSHRPVFEYIQLFRDPLDRGLAMCEDKTIEFWYFRPITRFLPMSGIVLGTLLSALLIFWRFRKKLVPHNSAAVPSV